MGTLTLQPSLLRDWTVDPGARHTLEDLIVARWGRISSGAVTTCPVCHGEMQPVWAAGSRPVAARCQDCGASLS
jgi:hypothetical protein